MGKWTGTLQKHLVVILFSLDKLYITHGEWASGEFGGGYRKRPATDDFERLPFDYCALTLRPFTHPVCSVEGTVFELSSIIPYIEKHGRNPVTGTPLQPSQLVRIHFSRNAADEPHCPITLRAFNDHSNIVVNRRTGNVYSKEGVTMLHKQSSRWRDFITDEPFSREDLIVLQDPEHVQERNLSSFQHVQRTREEQEKGPQGLGSQPAVTKLSFPATGRAEGTYSQGKASSSVTSTALSPVIKNELKTIDEQASMFTNVKGIGKASIRTNIGDVHVELYCQKTPRTCYNFIQLARRGYYAGSRFHRLIPGFMVQGGDPDGTGAGGESCWGKPFKDEFVAALSHNSRGILAMANKSRPNSNGSQFYITFAAQPHLDRVHTIFGKMIGGHETLDAIEGWPVDSSAKPVKPIIIQDVIIVKDPFEEYQKLKATSPQLVLDKQARARADPTLAIKRAKSAVNTPATIGKYLKKAPQ